LELYFTKAGDLGSLPDMVREQTGKEGLRQIERRIDVQPGVFDNPASVVLYRDNYRFFSLAADMLGCRSIALNMGSTDDARNLGLYGQYLLSAPDFLTGLRRTVSMPRLTRNFSYQILEIEGDLARFGYRCIFQGSQDWRHQADLMVTYMVAMFMHYVSDISLLDRIEVSYPAGPYVQDMEDRFGVPVIHGKKADGIVFDRSALYKRPPEYKSSLAFATVRDVHLERQERQHALPDQIRFLISRRLAGRRTDLEGLAMSLDTGTRTIQRRLSEFGTSYRELLEGERKARAFSFLSEGHLTIDEIALALGYATRTQFIRAFKGWTGISPRKFISRYSSAEV